MPIEPLVKFNVRCVLILSLIARCCVAGGQERASQTWIKLTTPSFELYTDATSAKAKDLLELFETAECTALRPEGREHTEADKPLRIIAFANSEEYAPFRLKTAALGHYLHARNRDYIVLADAEPEHFEAAVHEYTHYAVNRAGFHLPLWLNEGIADLYSTTASKLGVPLLGAPLSGRLSTLTNNPLLPLREVFATERASALYSDPAKTPVFYAQSWAFARLLALDNRFAPRFPELLGQISAGETTTGALWNIYRMTLEQFDAQLPAYIRQMQGGRPVRSATDTQGHIAAEETKLSLFEQHMIWADLLAAHGSTASKAKELLLELEKENPGDPRTQELLGHIAWTEKHPNEAQAHWTQAVDRGSQDFETLYRLALVLQRNAAPVSKVIGLMEKALSMRPDCDEAIYNLGVLKYGDGQYEGASQTLLRLQRVAPEQAYTYYSVLAYCEMKMKTFDRAKALLIKAAESARTAEQQAENSQMLRFATARAD